MGLRARLAVGEGLLDGRRGHGAAMIPARGGDATIARLRPCPTTAGRFPSAVRRRSASARAAATARPRRPEAPVFSCPACGFHFHFNPAVAAGVIVGGRDGRVLLVRRAKEPARGLLGFPGGFVDIGESAEEAVAPRGPRGDRHRGRGPRASSASWPNLYEWRGVAYPVVDLYFTGRARRRGDGLGAARGRGDRVAAPRGGRSRGARLPDHPRGVRPASRFAKPPPEG